MKNTRYPCVVLTFMIHHNTSTQTICCPTCVVTRYGSKQLKYNNTCGLLHVENFTLVLQEGPSKESPSHPWVRHPGRSDSTCNCGRLRGCGASWSWDGSGGSNINFQNFPNTLIHRFYGSNLLISIGKRMKLFERSLEVKLPTIWTDEKQSWAEAERREE